MKTVIIAAGQGSRLSDRHHGLPKSLLEIDDKRLIDYILGRIAASGLRDVVIVTGFAHEVLQREITVRHPEGIRLEFVHNPRWELANGISVLSAREAIPPGEPFMLMMSDHVFDLSLLEKMKSVELAPGQVCVGLDFKIDQIFDLPDGMKVQCQPSDGAIHTIQHLDKNLTQFDAIDCGMFKCTSGLFDALEQAAQNGNCSLSDACNILCQTEQMKGLDIGDSFWIDLDTPEALDYFTSIERGQRA